MQARGSKEVNSLLHGYVSGFSLSSVPFLLCDTGQVSYYHKDEETYTGISFLSCPVTFYILQIL